MKTSLLMLLSLALCSSLAAADGTKRMPSSNVELCGALSGECLNGGSCAHFISNDSGEHPVFGANKKAAAQLSDFVEKNVCASGHYSRQGFIASQVRLAMSAE